MNRIAKIAVIAAGLAFSFSAQAGSKTDSQLLTECKASVNEQFENASKVRVANITSRRNVFKAKFKVSAEGERSVVLCTIAGDQPVALTCLNGNCPADMIAAN